MTFEAAQSRLAAHGQAHVLRFWDRLDESGRAALLRQVAALDLEQVDRLKSLITGGEGQRPATDIAPATVEHLAGEARAAAVEAGERSLKAGRVGVILVAGGQGTRLGFDGPKGAYPIAPVTQASLFALHARKLLGLKRKYGADLPFYVMTSEANDAATRAFFAEHACFGLEPANVKFFVQGMWPALMPDGRLILDRPDRIFMSPDGHGGTLSALRDRGMLDDMRSRGLETLFYFQVDNPLVQIADPAFIGLHEQRSADVSLKVCAKRDANEGLGVVVARDGRNALVEYTELTHEQKHATTPDGELRFKFGSVAIHVFALAFLRQQADVGLPVHVTHKKVAHCDESGRTVEPDKPNAYKFEKFIFDVLPNAERVVNLAFAREDEFSPVKNGEGADSPATCRRDLVRKYARWLEASGVEIPRDGNGDPLHAIEIDPALAIGPADLAGKLDGLDLRRELVLA